MDGVKEEEEDENEGWDDGRMGALLEEAGDEYDEELEVNVGLEEKELELEEVAEY